MASILLGLTGSIGMGKSTTAQMFADKGCPIWDADIAVHALYQKDAAGYQAIQSLVPLAAKGPAVDRAVLKDAIAKTPDLLTQIEALIHPLVAADRETFKITHAEPVLVFDIPLLFETNAQDQFDAVACVATSASLQRARVMERPGMTKGVFEMILAKQMPSPEKEARADFVIDTTTLKSAQACVDQVFTTLQKRLSHA